VGRLGLIGFVCVLGGVAIGACRGAYAADCTDPLGHLVSVEGAVELQRAGAADWQPATLDEALCAGDTVRVGDRSRAAAALLNDNKLRLDQNSTLRLIQPEIPDRSLLDLWSGAAYFFSRKRQSLDIRTPVVNAAVEGTEFLIRIGDAETLLGVVHGRIRASNAQGEISLGDGEAATATATTPPVSTLLVRPLDAVQWAIYYPSILPFVYDPGARAPADLPADLAAAVDAASAGRTPEAFARFAAIPESGRDVDFHLYRAAALLGVGRADEASADITAALAIDPNNATAYGLRAVIAIARNDTAQGLADANRAVELDPASAPALIARSYAEQAQFRIDAARETAERATTAAPDNALAWARLSELWLMQGWRERSREAADRARALAPDLERVHTVAGFAALSEFDTTRAQDEFRRAIAISPGNPQPRLGLGLATIRTGSLRQGRRDLELAVLLDPDNALLRSYLGKAYFDEKRNPLAASQFDLAKEIDPNDPTAFFYSAIQKQTENRPVEALRDLEKSIALNDDRAVYRSRELLDSDRAARGASLGRIYDDLGFQQLGVNAATRSLSFDPSNAAAHRFLSDIYVSQPRHEISRLSEQLQAQLLQDININPVQPSLNVTDFNIITTGGPARPGFNEFNPLFERNQAQLNVTGLGGSHNTWGNEAVVSGLYDRYSISAGQFHYQTDGFRENADLQSDIYNFYAQAAASPRFNMQGEFNAVRNENGFLPLLFEASNYDHTSETSTQYTGRVGMRYTPSPRATLLTSFIYGNFDFDTNDDDDVEFDQKVKLKGYQGEAAYLFNGSEYSVVGGAAYLRNNTDIDILDPSLELYSDTTDRYEVNQESGYAYFDLRMLKGVIGTLGASVDNYKERDINFFRFNPKVGVQWEIVPHVTARAAVFRTVKPQLVNSRTIQPTQVAGFNQFYDDPNGTEAWRYGAAIDAQISKSFSSGIELSERRIQENLQPFFTDEDDVKEQRREKLAQLYGYWAINDDFALSGRFIYDNYTSEDSLYFVPSKVETISFPLSLRFFHPSGFFSSLTWSFVRQDVNYSGDASTFEGTSNFNLIDAVIGYRLPKRLGILSIQATNLLNQEFNYQDDSFREFARDQAYSRFIPERSIIGRATLNF
jgi:Cytochrome c biogenesis factor